MCQMATTFWSLDFLSQFVQQAIYLEARHKHHQPCHHLVHLSATELVWPPQMGLFFPSEMRQLTLQFQLGIHNELVNSEYRSYC